MEIRFYTAGGIRGRLPQEPLTIKESDLSRDEQDTLGKLVLNAKKTTCTITPGDARPDRMYYRIELNDFDGSFSWEVAETNIQEDVWPLVQWLKQREK